MLDLSSSAIRKFSKVPDYSNLFIRALEFNDYKFLTVIIEHNELGFIEYEYPNLTFSNSENKGIY